jgi:hypothetical protein
MAFRGSHPSSGIRSKSFDKPRSWLASYNRDMPLKVPNRNFDREPFMLLSYSGSDFEDKRETGSLRESRD